jgi:hypothetical protein
MKIAKIVSSNSHLDYVARVIDSLDVENPPSSYDFGFAQFVKIGLEKESIIGVIHNSMLVNPEYSNYGPRLSPKPDLANFSPDYINEQGLLIGILLLGAIDEHGNTKHGIPRRVIPPGNDVFKIDNKEIADFHLDEKGGLQIHYYAQLIAHAGALGVPLLESIIEQLLPECQTDDKNRLDVLKQTLAWQRTLGAMRL